MGDYHEVGDSVLKSLICFNFYRGWREISEFYRRYLPDGISAQQTYVLELCSTEHQVGVGDIARQLEIDVPAISSLLGRMERNGLIRREVLASNRRHTCVFLTEQGAAVRDKVRSQMEAADRHLFSHLSQKDLDQLILLVDKIKEVPCPSEESFMR